LTTTKATSYDLLTMQTGLQRIMAVLTAFAVLAVSFNCVCAGMVSPSNNQVMPCCARHHPGTHCPHQSSKSSPCSSNCAHCAHISINDTVVSPSLHGAHADWNPILVIAAPTNDFARRVLIASAVGPAGLSPPSTSSTLLSLHCALII
jgi:hypothetical protein